jgi:hypothetical protein
MTPEQAEALRKPFEAHQIGKIPKGGVQLDYVGHAACTDRLLAVDPEWTWEPLATDERGLPALDEDRNLWIRLTVCGVTRLGVGDGPDAKQRIGDAIRNAAMRFGVALDLWSKEDLNAPEPEPTGDEIARDQGFLNAAEKKTMHDEVAARIKALPESVDRTQFTSYRANKGWPMDTVALSGLMDLVEVAEGLVEEEKT